MSPGLMVDHSFESTIFEGSCKYFTSPDIPVSHDLDLVDSSSQIHLQTNDDSLISDYLILHDTQSLKNVTATRENFEENVFLDNLMEMLELPKNDAFLSNNKITESFNLINSEDFDFHLDLSNNSSIEKSLIYKNEDLSKNDWGISVLGVDLDICNNHENLDYMSSEDLDKLINITELNEFNIKDIKMDDLFKNDTLEYGLNFNNTAEIESEPREMNIQQNFVNNERNLKRRSLLFESSYRPPKSKENNSNPEEKVKHHRRHHALLQHDYTQKKCEDEKYFPCPMANCGKIYAKSSHLKAHIRRHSGEKPFVCNWANCTWKFSRSDELARHKRSHSGIKPYKCEMCEKAFARSDHLSKHRKVHRKKMAQHGHHYINRRMKNS